MCYLFRLALFYLAGFGLYGAGPKKLPESAPDPEKLFLAGVLGSRQLRLHVIHRSIRPGIHPCSPGVELDALLRPRKDGREREKM
jgi:hypothetical protein